VKKNIKNTRINDLVSENEVLSGQIDKLKNLYKNSQFKNQNLQGNIQDVNTMKDALSKQDFMIINFQENNQKMIEVIKDLHFEIEKLKRQKDNKVDMINKLKQKLKYHQQINERLVMKRDNIQATDEYLSLKNKYESKLQKIKKDLAYYKDSNSKNEKILKELKQFQK
jgi:chromosome segregation ATPase